MAISERLVQYPSGGLNMHGFLALPDVAKPAPGLLVIQEWWGLNDHIRDIAKRLAREGYPALAPDLYSRLGHVVTTDAHQAGQLMASLKHADALKDLAASLTFLSAQPGVIADRLGVVGFCMGGSYALELACAQTLRLAVPFYGQVPPPDTLRHLSCPVLYFYGGRDNWITRPEVERLGQVLRGTSRGEVCIYESSGHAFFNDTRSDAYDAKAAHDAWQKLLAFVRRYL